jgi:hypothetical protein
MRLTNHGVRCTLVRLTDNVSMLRLQRQMVKEMLAYVLADGRAQPALGRSMQ